MSDILPQQDAVVGVLSGFFESTIFHRSLLQYFFPITYTNRLLVVISMKLITFGHLLASVSPVALCHLNSALLSLDFVSFRTITSKPGEENHSAIIISPWVCSELPRGSVVSTLSPGGTGDTGKQIMLSISYWNKKNTLLFPPFPLQNFFKNKIKLVAFHRVYQLHAESGWRHL